MKASAYIFLIMAGVIASGCGSAWKLKRAQKLINSAIENGAKVDSLKTVIRDTIKIAEIQDRVQVVRLTDTVTLIQKCKELIQKPSAPKVTSIYNIICPEVAIDSTYRIVLTVQGRNYTIPVRVAITSNKGGFSYGIKSGAVEAPFVKEEVKVGISAGYTGWGLIWRILVIGFIPGFAVCWVLKTFRII